MRSSLGMALVLGFAGAMGPSGAARAADTTLTFSPAYVDCSHWQKETKGADKAKASCNRQSGSLGVLTTAWVGAAAADAKQYVHFTVDADSRVTLDADFTYVGGASTNGFGSFAGFYAVWRVDGRDQERQAIDPAFGFDDIKGKIVDLALLAGGATAASSTAEAIDMIGLVVSAQQLSDALDSLVTSKKAKRYHLRKTFSVKKGSHRLGVGLLGSASAALTGSAFVVLAGQADRITLTIRAK